MLFVPLGMSLAAWGSVCRPPRLRGLMTALFAGALFSVLLETAQIFLPSRDASLNDVMANSLGSVTGFFCFSLGEEGIAGLLAFLERKVLISGIPRPGTLFLVYLIAALGSSWSLQRMTSLLNWEDSFPLLFGNEHTGDRPWLGQIVSFQVADRALPRDKSLKLSSEAPDDFETKDWLISYEFQSGSAAPAGFSWKGGAQPSAAGQGLGLQLPGIPWLESDAPPAAVTRALRASNQFTVRLRCIPAGVRQYGPARIVSISKDPYHRDFTLGQEGESLSVRLRTRLTGENGTEPELFVPFVFAPNRPVTIVVTYDGANLRAFVNGEARTDSLALGPGAALGHIFISVLSLELKGYNLLYDGLVFLPLGFLLGEVTRTRSARRSLALLLALGVFLPSSLFEWALTAVSGKFFSVTNLALGIALIVIPLMLRGRNALQAQNNGPRHTS